MHRLDITDELMLDLGWGLASGSSRVPLDPPLLREGPGQGRRLLHDGPLDREPRRREARYRNEVPRARRRRHRRRRVVRVRPRPNQSVTYEDVLGSVFSLANGNYGAIRVTANVPSLNVLGQTATPVLTDWKSCVSSGFFGQSVPAVPASGLITAGTTRFHRGIRDDAAFRTNLILATPARRSLRST
jgi:hypothetical protein